jgi:RHH-type proline utilization regulon transcriptional repressor/proline dehydrogenase/delta 1-pyrroline-5-carboxylate dehydrogenase
MGRQNADPEQPDRQVLALGEHLHKDIFDEAIPLANQTKFTLTGAVYSRSPVHLDYARRALRVGNWYLNRGSTGTMVDRQPFGGLGMSGIGTKVGRPNYLLFFADPRSVTENTVRRGVVPDLAK